MKKILLFAVAVFSANAFSQIPNYDFENWTVHDDPGSTGIVVDSLESGYWESGNPLLITLPSLAPGMPKGFMYDTSYAHSGSHAVALRTGFLNGLTATGNLFSGMIDNSVAGINQVLVEVNPLAPATTGQPSTDKPVIFGGYFYYEPAPDYLYFNDQTQTADTLFGIGDSCRITCLVHKWNSTLDQRDTIGIGDFFYDQHTTGGFQPFSIPVNYMSSDAPDSISIMFLSSFGGTQFAGSPGSLLIIDSIYFDGYLSTDNQMNQNDLKVYSYENVLTIQNTSNEMLNCEILNLNGQVIESFKVGKGQNKFPMSLNGVYIVRILDKNFLPIRNQRLLFNN